MISIVQKTFSQFQRLSPSPLAGEGRGGGQLPVNFTPHPGPPLQGGRVNRPPIARLALWAILLTMVSGCGPKLAQVKGKVTFAGKPLAKGTIIFEAKGKKPATGFIVDGQIVEVTTYKKGDGVPVGQHQIAISALADPAGSAVVTHPGEKTNPASYMTQKSLIPAAYNDPQTSKLAADVKAGENQVDFQLSSKGP